MFIKKLILLVFVSLPIFCADCSWRQNTIVGSRPGISFTYDRSIGISGNSAPFDSAGGAILSSHTSRPIDPPLSYKHYLISNTMSFLQSRELGFPDLRSYFSETAHAELCTTVCSKTESLALSTPEQCIESFKTNFVDYKCCYDEWKALNSLYSASEYETMWAKVMAADQAVHMSHSPAEGRIDSAVFEHELIQELNKTFTPKDWAILESRLQRDVAEAYYQKCLQSIEHASTALAQLYCDGVSKDILPTGFSDYPIAMQQGILDEFHTRITILEKEICAERTSISSTLIKLQAIESDWFKYFSQHLKAPFSPTSAELITTLVKSTEEMAAIKGQIHAIENTIAEMNQLLRNADPSMPSAACCRQCITPTLSADTAAFIEHQGLNIDNFRHFEGGTLEAEIFQQNVSIISDSADLAKIATADTQIMDYVSTSAQLSSAAIDLLHEKDIERSSALTDISAGLLEAGKISFAVGKGVAEGMVDVVRAPIDLGILATKGVVMIGKAGCTAIAHPIDTGNKISAGVEKLIAVSCDMAHGDFTALDSMGKTATAYATGKSSELCKQFAELPIDQKAEGLARFVTSLLAPGPTHLAKVSGLSKGLEGLSRIGLREAEKIFAP